MAPSALTFTLTAVIIILVCLPVKQHAQSPSSTIISISDIKDFKKILRTKTNVLVVYFKNEKVGTASMKILNEVAELMKGKATLVLISCRDAKKLCKKYKVSLSTSSNLWHYHNGDFNKIYDRRFTTKSLVTFLHDPKGETPWEEDDTAASVMHVNTPTEFYKVLRKSKIPILVMFYAPWCGYCKRLKPDYAAAAAELKGQTVLMAADVDKEEQVQLRSDFNITSFPTLYYFENGKLKYKYGGENSKDGIIKWLKDPQPFKEPEKEAEWSEEESDVVHLDDESFNPFIADHSSVLVMFYAPWCGHCKQMKPDYAKAAAQLKEDNINGILAAVDATKASALGQRFAVKGFPTVKYFKDGEFTFDVSVRTRDKIVDFMKDPKEPPPEPAQEPSWEDTESDVYHLSDANFKTSLKKKKHALIMFYAPWCGHCKKAKPEFVAAAAHHALNNKVAYGAVDCTKQTALCATYEVSGYPTFKYFNYGKDPQNYNGAREEADFISFMGNPFASSPPAPAQQKRSAADDWVDIPGSQHVHILAEDMFDSFISQHESVLVMFYAPWCGHCKKMKPAYSEAAKKLHDENIPFILAAVDATLETPLSTRFEVKSFPTLKFFKNGEYKFDYSGQRTLKHLVKFAKNPKAPPPPEPEWSEVKSAIHHLTAENLDEFLAGHSGTLVMFYTPWCGHCKVAKPEYQAAADEWAGKNDREFAAIDCVKHKATCKKSDVKGYPTFIYFSKGQKVADYNGARKKQQFIAFMENQPQIKEEL